MLSVALSRYTHVTLRHRICAEIHTHGTCHIMGRVLRYKHGTCHVMGFVLRYTHGTCYVMEHWRWETNSDDPLAKTGKGLNDLWPNREPEKMKMSWHHFATQDHRRVDIFSSEGLIFEPNFEAWKRTGAVAPWCFFQFCGPVTGPPGCLCSAIWMFARVAYQQKYDKILQCAI